MVSLGVCMCDPAPSSPPHLLGLVALHLPTPIEKGFEPTPRSRLSMFGKGTCVRFDPLRFRTSLSPGVEAGFVGPFPSFRSRDASLSRLGSCLRHTPTRRGGTHAIASPWRLLRSARRRRRTHQNGARTCLPLHCRPWKTYVRREAIAKPRLPNRDGSRADTRLASCDGAAGRVPEASGGARPTFARHHHLGLHLPRRRDRGRGLSRVARFLRLYVHARTYACASIRTSSATCHVLTSS